MTNHMPAPTSTSRNSRCALTVLLRTNFLKACEFRCSGSPRLTHFEASRYPELVIPQVGAYIRKDSSGCVYLDQTVMGFFEANRPYQIEHLENRPDITTVISITDPLDLSSLFGSSSYSGRLFMKSAIRMTPELHMQHQKLLACFRSSDNEHIDTEEKVIMLVTAALETSCLLPDLTYSGDGPGRTAESVLTPVVEYIRANYRRSLTLDEVAAFSGYSVFYLCRLFNARMKMSIYQYVKSLRMEAAYSTLTRTTDPVTAIAMELGYSSHAHFTSQFTNWFGVSPSEVRKS